MQGAVCKADRSAYGDPVRDPVKEKVPPERDAGSQCVYEIEEFFVETRFFGKGFIDAD